MRPGLIGMICDGSCHHRALRRVAARTQNHQGILALNFSPRITFCVRSSFTFFFRAVLRDPKVLSGKLRFWNAAQS